MTAFIVIAAIAIPLAIWLAMQGNYVTIPSGAVGVTSERVYPAGERVFVRDPVAIYHLNEVVHTVNTLEYGSHVVSWRPDPSNIRALISAGDEEGILLKLESILAANPQADLRRYERQLGINFIDVPDNIEPPDPNEVDIDIEIGIATKMVTGIKDLEAKRAAFFIANPDTWTNLELRNHANNAFDQVRDRILKAR
ncbi:MAG TPA: hypothetical protein VGQ76_24295 [Thermoanaerobaculia bacterium]|nr:hypothetical protein [Thermoanaerobaculia bacterium]